MGSGSLGIDRYSVIICSSEVMCATLELDGAERPGAEVPIVALTVVNATSNTTVEVSVVAVNRCGVRSATAIDTLVIIDDDNDNDGKLYCM